MTENIAENIKNDTDLSREIQELRRRLAEAEETLQAIRSGEVDGLIINDGHGEQVFTLTSADHPYRMLIEQMNEGAVTLSPDGNILYCNRSFARMMNISLQELMGTPILDMIHPDYQPYFQTSSTWQDHIAPGEINLLRRDGTLLPVCCSINFILLEGTQCLAMVVTDLSDIKERASELKLANQQLERARDELESRVLERTAELQKSNDDLNIQITERKKAEAALRDNEVRLEEQVRERTQELADSNQTISNILESIKDPFFTLDKEWRFLFVNESAQEQFSNYGSLVGRNIWDLFPKMANSIFWDKYHKVMDSKMPLSFEAQTLYTGFWFQVSVYPFADGISVLFRDITDRKEAEEELRKSRELLYASIENMIDCFGIYTSVRDESGEIVDFIVEYVNQAACISNKLIKQEQIGKSYLQIFPWSRGSNIFEEHRQVVETGEPLIKETYVNENDENENRLGIYEYRNVKLGDGFISTWRNITERKEAENALRMSEMRFYNLFHNSSDAITIVNLEGVFIDVNQRLLDIFEYSREEVIGHSMDELNMRADEPAYIKPLYNKLLEEGVLDNIESRMRTKSGRIITALSSVVLMDINGEMCRVSTLKDITREKEIESEMAKLDRLNLIGEMAASIGHEIRNPMTSIRGFLQMLNSKESYQEDRAFFDLMIEELDRANDIISEYLGMAKDKKVDLEPQYLDEIVKSLYPMIQADANYQEMDVQLELGKPPMPLIDAKEIRQLILNMTRNGLEAMSPGGILTIGTTAEENEIILFIKDQGSGLPPELTDKLGTPFFTTKEKGTGLGLAVCYSIAARHNARIDHETGPDGTTFYIRFPGLVEQGLLF